MKKAKNTPVFDRRAATGIQKRPDHGDFKTSAEHAAAKFTGIRQNTMVMEWEFWILGEIVKKVHFSAVKKDPLALTKAHIEVFHLSPEPGVFK